MIQDSINQMLNIGAAIAGGGKIIKGQQEQTKAIQELTTQQKEYANNLTAQHNLTPEEANQVTGQFAQLEQQPGFQENYDQLAKEMEKASIYKQAQEEADARWQEQAKQSAEQAKKYQEHVDALRGRLQYIASANMTDDKGVYANRAIRKDTQKFLAEDEKKYGGAK